MTDSSLPRRPVGRVLLVAWMFPPAQVIGALRVSKMARYLPEFGWETRVLTADPELLPFARAMQVEVPDEQVVRVRFADPLSAVERWRRGRAATPAPSSPEAAADARTAEPRRDSRWWVAARGLLRFFPIDNQVRLPDRSLFWLRAALHAGREECIRRRPDVLVSSHGPPGAHIVASSLAREFGIPWVADYRDPWSGHYGRRYPAALEAVERRIERAVVRPAVALTTVSDQLADFFRALHGKPVVTVFNGFDEADYAEPVEPSPGFVITFTGVAEAPFRDPAPLFDAVARLRGALPAGMPLPRLRFVGSTHPDYLRGLAVRFGVDDLLEAWGSVARDESVRLQRASTVLLAINWGGEAAGVLSGKLMEYLGAGRPVLAIGPHDPGVSDVLRRTGVGVWANDPAELASILEEWVRRHAASGALDIGSDRAAIAAFSRRAQTGRLAALLDQVAVRRG